MNCVPSSAGLYTEASNKQIQAELQTVSSFTQDTGFSWISWLFTVHVDMQFYAQGFKKLTDVQQNYLQTDRPPHERAASWSDLNIYYVPRKSKQRALTWLSEVKS